MTSFKEQLDILCKEHDVSEMHIIFQSTGNIEPVGVTYVNLDDKEYQFFKDGESPTNYLSHISLSNPKCVVIYFKEGSMLRSHKIINKGDVTFQAFYDLIQKIGGQKFVKRYFGNSYVFSHMATTVHFQKAHITI